MNKEDLLKFTQLYQQMLMENEEYQKQNEELQAELHSVRQELDLFRQMMTSYGGKSTK